MKKIIRESLVKRHILFFVVMLTTFNMSTQAQAGTLCVSGYVCDDRPLAPALPIQPPLNTPIVFQPSPIVLVPFQDSTGWNYGFAAPLEAKTVVMPYFTDSSIFSVRMPDGWTYTVDKQGADSRTTVIWQSVSASSTTLGYFSFRSSYSPAEAIYQFNFENGSTRNYQLFIPFSPLAKASGYTSFSASVPEPSSIYMSAFGFFMCIVATRRRKNG
ncbi:hypothetical protein Q9292_09470 [Methylophilus sp. VKM B-3414]|uniref:hypothetical protein n=1 Tax=Methylophilus sp. VKM B-3414 TaxID=3076121 RepID=UPI0028C8D80F|nr:hypothetical protein [Methylophilus sp. VKM B-3414]MDT7849839.1 hypothetical protein [Methylophilus sp. VKM B-3414]